MFGNFCPAFQHVLPGILHRSHTVQQTADGKRSKNSWRIFQIYVVLFQNWLITQDPVVQSSLSVLSHQTGCLMLFAHPPVSHVSGNPNIK
jgi:hypothetical protein